MRWISRARHAEDGAVEEDVFAAGELGVKAGADFEQAADAAAELDAAVGGLGDAAQDFEQGRFAGAVAADDADDFAGLDFEANILERPEFAGLVPGAAFPAPAKSTERSRDGAAQRFLQRRIVRFATCAQVVELGQVVDADGGFHGEWVEILRSSLPGEVS